MFKYDPEHEKFMKDERLARDQFKFDLEAAFEAINESLFTKEPEELDKWKLWQAPWRKRGSKETVPDSVQRGEEPGVEDQPPDEEPRG